jgi:cytochrome c peroxidase
MPDLIRHPVCLFLDSGVRRNDRTAASRGECTLSDSKWGPRYPFLLEELAVMRNSRNLLVVGLLLVFLSVVPEPVLPADDEALLNMAKGVLGILPAVMTTDQNPVTPEKINLGRMLFYEMRISIDGTISCSKCHPVSLYAADGLRKSSGNKCKVNPRNAPTVFNAAAQIAAHWIGNRTSVEDQAKQSVVGPPSFGMPSYASVEDRLRKSKEYVALFKKAFPGEKEPVTIDHFAMAVGAFERILVTPSPFDAFLKGDKKALTDIQKKGLKTFVDVGCATCHSGAYVGGQMYERFGVFESYWKLTKSEEIDEGRYGVTKTESDKYVFKVPVLRNVGRTAPYFHDGSVDELKEAVMIMGKIQMGKDLSNQQNEEIASFLHSLTGKIPEDALKVPVLPIME